jgi:oligoribonuclease
MNVFWLDLETTGLDENTCKILEVSVIITDNFFKEIEAYSKVIGYKDEEIIPQMNAWCNKTHTESGLLTDVKYSGITLASVETDLINLVRKHFTDGTSPMLAGNSIHFDRRFIKKYMPVFENLLTYRMIDVSSTWEQFRIFRNINIPKPEGNHRGLSDTRTSIALCKQLMFYVMDEIDKEFLEWESR